MEATAGDRGLRRSIGPNNFRGNTLKNVSRLPGPRSPLALLSFFRAAQHDSYAALTDLRERYGPIVRMGVGPATVVFAFGPDANETILSAAPAAFRWREAMKALIPVDGDTALVVSDGEDHARRRRLVQPGFHKRRIDSYVDLMTAEANQVLDSIPTGDVVDAYALFRVSIRRTVVLALFGDHLRSRADEIGELLQPAFDFINLPLLRQLKLPWPGTHYHRARTARAAVDAVIDEEIERRASKTSEDGGDVLSMLLATRDDDGTGLSRQEIRDQVVSLIAAGYETTASAMAWVVWRIANEPGVWARVRTELDAVVANRPVTTDDLPKLVVLDGVIRETLRLHPPGVVAPRKVIAPVEIGGYPIPRGALVLYSAYITGRDPRCWTEPERFLPERWDASAPGYTPPSPYASVTFGGGARRCIGFAFAELELKLMTVALVRRADVTPITTVQPRPTGIASAMPAGGVNIRVIRIDPAAT